MYNINNNIIIIKEKLFVGDSIPTPARRLIDYYYILRPPFVRKKILIRREKNNNNKNRNIMLLIATDLYSYMFTFTLIDRRSRIVSKYENIDERLRRGRRIQSDYYIYYEDFE